MDDLIQAATATADAALAMFDRRFDEKKRKTYHYEEVILKRWILGSGGASGQNCEACESCADLGWIDIEDLYDEGSDPVDEPPLHPHCDCQIEYKSSRKRVYD